ncbi:1-deoxy-D-xylulose-5-phosphate synthase [Burkholderia metallica]|uniref:1-deoxy-D-xylulose-5-phosphate synthase n=1 Tax=Burkholderia metallica TaxID=488729 RepID=UPI001CF287B0|nr:1-deoxy-D-xylulose-5-phosphate synthase [Burkholderia metallica]MCA8003438.1 1-deoxy-D-xylulose-5-phosphate synthase [Burkholderia metallica]
MYDLLKTIDDPADLRRLDRRQLQPLADELRAFVLDSVSKTGGHLSSNLGMVELTIALHYVFNTPDDRIVWDVGHQTYPHKILTGRRDQMHSLRQQDGISGFPRRSESEYDTFGTAHSSTSISAALGMAIGSQLNGDDRCSIAVIGDGAMTAGMAFEAMNNAGVSEDAKLLVILNDNNMSISPPVGALNRHLARLLSGRFYAAARAGVERVLSVAPPMLGLARKLEEHAKGMVVPATLFEEFGFNYIGPIDGHDLDSLIPTLQNIRELRGPQFLHVVTKKGQGYKLAEADPVLYHGPGKFNPAEGIKPSATPAKKTYTQVFGEWLCDEAERDTRVVGITPAMREGSGMVEFEKRFKDRYYDVGIAEQHAVTFAGGLATEGLKPVVAIYSTFLQRAYDQLIHDVALQNLPVVFAIDRAGLVGADGATHAGAYDLAFMRCIPNMTIMAASDENECRQMLHTALQQPNPTAVRYPRGAGTGVATVKEFTEIPLGKGEVRRHTSQPEGKRVAILAFGTMVAPSLAAAEELDATVANMRFVKPVDAALVCELAETHDYLVTVEEGCVMGGAGSACVEALMEKGCVRPVFQLGIRDAFVAQGERVEILSQIAMDGAGIARSIKTNIAAVSDTSKHRIKRVA